MTLRTSLAIICLFSIFSCSVKETRYGCPCVLAIDLKERSNIDNTIYINVENAVEPGNGEILLKGIDSDIIRVKVRKGTNRIVCAEGLGAGSIDVHNVRIPVGEESPKIRIASDEIDCSGESQYYAPVLHKEWTELRIGLTCTTGSEYPYILIIDGNVDGFDLVSGTPLNGKFSCEARQEETTNEARIYLPRQNPEGQGLKLSLISKDDYSVWKEYDLSGIITKTGYNWTKSDLDDIKIDLDYSGQLSLVTVTDWQTGLETSIRI